MIIIIIWPAFICFIGFLFQIEYLKLLYLVHGWQLTIIHHEHIQMILVFAVRRQFIRSIGNEWRKYIYFYDWISSIAESHYYYYYFCGHGNAVIHYSLLHAMWFSNILIFFQFCVEWLHFIGIWKIHKLITLAIVIFSLLFIVIFI